MSSIGQDEHKTLETLFQNVDLSLAEKQARQCFHTAGPGRPPRNPLGLLRAFIIMRMKEIRSLRELSRTLDVDQRLRRICLVEDGERGYTRSVLSRFTTLFGAEKLRGIIDEKVVALLRRSRVEEVDAVLDASFIKAWSIRHPRDSRRGFSDPDARVGRHGRGYDLGYKLTYPWTIGAYSRWRACWRRRTITRRGTAPRWSRGRSGSSGGLERG